MSNPDSFIDEVTEEVRRDRMFAMMRRYGWIALLLVALVVGGAAWTEWQKAQTRADAQAFGDALLDALDLPAPEDRLAALSAVEAPGSADAAALRDLLAASDPESDRAAALTALERVAADGAASQVYRDLAVLRQVLLAGTEMEISARRAALDPLTVPGRAFRPLALEQIAYLEVEAGNTEAAITQLRALLADQQAPTGLRQRAGQMIVALGGESAEG
ncbi:hypothetical protein [Szabonella alba]|uniref:Tetratricopeptide repeat-like domain-containing protein n=1 Tax=Szabonella alba TaxID=2804194 RepID=A0A8K0VD60_9RHOB|nr:hypothetical protein [Szabonella alba]MBL4917534.1 hypothetical protein [Szabonella alba]